MLIVTHYIFYVLRKENNGSLMLAINSVSNQDRIAQKTFHI